MYSTRSFVVRVRHAPRKVAPASGGASPRPARSGMWQLAQLASYAARPAAACCAVNTPAFCCAMSEAAAPIRIIAAAVLFDTFGKAEYIKRVAVLRVSHVGCDRARHVARAAAAEAGRDGDVLTSADGER